MKYNNFLLFFIGFLAPLPVNHNDQEGDADVDDAFDQSIKSWGCGLESGIRWLCLANVTRKWLSTLCLIAWICCVPSSQNVASTPVWWSGILLLHQRFWIRHDWRKNHSTDVRHDVFHSRWCLTWGYRWRWRPWVCLRIFESAVLFSSELSIWCTGYPLRRLADPFGRSYFLCWLRRLNRAWRPVP